MAGQAHREGIRCFKTLGSSNLSGKHISHAYTSSNIQSIPANSIPLHINEHFRTT